MRPQLGSHLITTAANPDCIAGARIAVEEHPVKARFGKRCQVINGNLKGIASNDARGGVESDFTAGKAGIAHGPELG